MLPTCAHRLGLGPTTTRTLRRFRPISVLFVAHFIFKRSECSLDVSLYLHPKSLVLFGNSKRTTNRLFSSSTVEPLQGSPIVCCVVFPPPPFSRFLARVFLPLTQCPRSNLLRLPLPPLGHQHPQSPRHDRSSSPELGEGANIDQLGTEGDLPSVSMQLARCPLGGSACVVMAIFAS